ncbi:MAG: PQQ-like beta-propeller repeat protein, partial [Planctomycetaceae bacterium]|nr:PQQ-like beta-propeller repeat protein [Planctomycetaceae bacterium]
NAGYLDRFPRKVDLGTLLCFDEQSGQFQWQYSSPKIPREVLPWGHWVDWPMQGICSAPCVSGDRLWVMNNQAQLVCLDFDGFRDGSDDGLAQPDQSSDPQEADIIWLLDLVKQLHVMPHLVASTSPTIAGDLILVGTSHGVDPPPAATEAFPPSAKPDIPSFIAVNASTGEVVWSDNAPGANILDGQWSSPAWSVIGGIPQAVFAGGDGWVYGYDLRAIRGGRTELLWKFDCNPKQSVYMYSQSQGGRNNLIATPVIVGNRIYIATGQNPERGDGPGIVWCIDGTRRGDISPTLVVHKDRPKTPLAARRLQSCDVNGGEQEIPNPNSGAVWSYTGRDLDGNGVLQWEETMHAATGSVAVSDGLAVVADRSGLLHCLDADTGDVLWIYDNLAAISGTPLINKDQIYLGDEDGDLIVASLSRTKPSVQKFETGDSIMGSVVAANDRLFVPQMKSLLAYGRPEPDALSESATVPVLNSWLSPDESAISFQTDEEGHFILYSPSLMQNHLVTYHRGDGRWTMEGSVTVTTKSGRREVTVTADSQSPDTIVLDGDRLSLRDGRLLVFLPEQEVPAQLDCSSRLEGQRDVRRMGQYVGDSLKIRNPAAKSSP